MPHHVDSGGAGLAERFYVKDFCVLRQPRYKGAAMVGPDGRLAMDLEMSREPKHSQGPVVVLVEPQLGENIGAAARAMWNFALDDLRLVAPRDGWPSDKAVAMASGATPVLDRVRVFDSVEEAVADLHFVYATTARPRDMLKGVESPAAAATAMAARAARGERVGVLFGRERAGLTNEEVALADAVLTFPTNPEFSSLNIAQAVLIVGYAWFTAANGPEEGEPAAGVDEPRAQPATREEIFALFEHLEGELDAVGFFKPPEKRPAMVRNLRNLLHRAGLMEQDVRSLRGVVAALGRRHLRRREAAAEERDGKGKAGP
jgi:tRNA/rRNA methyltransferase